DVGLRAPRVDRPFLDLVQERREGARGEAPAPELAPDPVAHLAPPLEPEEDDIAGDVAVELDRPDDDARVAQDGTPVRHERVALPRRECGHPVRDGVPLVLEEDRKVLLGHAAEPHLAGGDRHTDHPARLTPLPATCLAARRGEPRSPTASGTPRPNASRAPSRAASRTAAGSERPRARPRAARVRRPGLRGSDR